jgi:hypothetical protein
MTKPKGFIIDKGLSPIDGKPYVAILIVKSTNRKTGNMAQVFIMRDDINPVEAINTGEDYTICGNCPHRRKQVWDAKRKRFKWERSCYVNVGQGPNSVWKAYKRGAYKLLWLDSEVATILKGRKIRWGAYGDPAIIDPKVVSYFNSLADGHTGYTHQWRESWAQVYNGVFQASCDGFNDYMVASDHGWKCFVVVSKTAAPDYAKQCPATVDNSKAQCITCSLCDGAKRDVYVNAHGSGAKYVVAA